MASKEERLASLQRLCDSLNDQLCEACFGEKCAKAREIYKAIEGVKLTMIKVKREGKLLKGGLEK